MAKTYGSIVSLVGENPLPIYLGIRQFAASGGRIVLVHSPQTRDHARSLERSLGGSGFTFVYESITDPFSPKVVADILADLAQRLRVERAALNFTGGTKVMSAFALQAWGDRWNDAFYLDEANGLFRFADGVDVRLRIEPALSLDNVSALHDVDMTNLGTRLNVPEVDMAMWTIRCTGGKVGIEGVDSSGNGYDWFKKQYGGTQPREWDEILGKLPEPASDWRMPAELPSRGRYDNSELKTRFKHLHGAWLETLLDHVVFKNLCGDGSIAPDGSANDVLLNPAQVSVSQNFKIGGVQFEADILVVHDNRLCYFSVTTAEKRLLKGKAFEAIHRAEQIGGGLARSSVLCLLPDATVGECQQAVDPQAKRHKIFGLDALRRWVDDKDARDLQQFIAPPSG
jgi:hypothetical protein